MANAVTIFRCTLSPVGPVTPAISFRRVPLPRPSLECSGFHRFGDEVALGDVAAQALQQVPVRARLHALGDRLEAELACHVEAGREDDLARFLLERAEHERLVDLELGER